ncbi:MAG: hypothetical protein VXW65_11455 [Pseudomonadota bacterium]|nr:hypothetical protein [Pseudomonadota bacterium]
MKRQLLVLSLSALLLAGCTSMQPRSFSSLGQFDQFQLNDQLYRIRYVGNGYTRQSEAEQIALVQAARVTLKHGYRYFNVVEDPSSSRVVPAQRPWNMGLSVYAGSGYYQPYSPYHSYYGGGWLLHDRFHSPYFSDWDWNDRVQVNYTIAVSKTKSKQQTQFDAQTIMRSLGSRYNLNPDGTERQEGQPSVAAPQATPLPTTAQ